MSLRSLPSPPTRADLLAGAAVAETPWHYSGKQTIAEFAENAEIIQMLTKTHEAENHKALCRVLGEHHGIALSIKDFVLKDECEDDGGYTIHPLQFAEIDDQSRLMVVSCHYEMASRQKKGGLTFDVSPDSITFHLFETAATR